MPRNSREKSLPHRAIKLITVDVIVQWLVVLCPLHIIEAVSKEAVEDTDINRNEVSVNAKKKAAVWDCITELRGGGARCNFCDKTFKMQDKSTSNAIRHLRSVHHNEQLVKNMIWHTYYL